MHSSHFFTALAAFVLLLQAPAWSGDGKMTQFHEWTDLGGAGEGQEELADNRYGATGTAGKERHPDLAPATEYGTRAGGGFIVADTDVEYAVIAPTSFAAIVAPS